MPPGFRGTVEAMPKKIRVLIVDDSAVVRQTMCTILSSDPRIDVIGTAADPYIAASKIAGEVPDVITLDIEMPRMDGLTFLRKLMQQHPLPVVICSSLASEGSETALTALDYGAVDIIQKPVLMTRQFLLESQIRICDAVKAAAVCRPKIKTLARRIEPKFTADVILKKPKFGGMLPCEASEKVLVIGASTGGTEALRVLLAEFPEDSPGMVIVQHMPENFTSAFARRLNSICRLDVREARDNDSILRGRVLIAPGNYHILVKRNGSRYYVKITQGPLVCRHRPSVDVLFRSAARYAGKNGIGVILTGMGDDGAQGMLEMKEAGAFNLAQDEETCTVFGMPQEAVKMGGVHRVLPLKAIPAAILELSGKA